jgi:sec-independent protein translocase protein TatC
MSFFDHLEALRWHIIRSCIAIFVASVLIFIFITPIYSIVILGPTRSSFITFRFLCSLDHRLNLGSRLCSSHLSIKFQNLEVSGQFMLALTSSLIIGMIIAVPYILWEFWTFVKPALKPTEAKYTRGVVFWSSLQFFLGVAFAYFCIAPYAMSFFSNYRISTQFENIFTIQSYLDLIIQLVVGLGCVFELPILVYFLTKVGILSPQFLRTYRKQAILVIVGVAAFIAPPDITSQFVVSIPLYVLYEISIYISARVMKQKARDEEKWV